MALTFLTFLLTIKNKYQKEKNNLIRISEDINLCCIENTFISKHFIEHMAIEGSVWCMIIRLGKIVLAFYLKKTFVLTSYKNLK